MEPQLVYQVCSFAWMTSLTLRQFNDSDFETFLVREKWPRTP